MIDPVEAGKHHEETVGKHQEREANLMDRIGELEAENALLTERVKTLESVLPKGWTQETTHWHSMFQAASSRVKDLEQEIHGLHVASRCESQDIAHLSSQVATLRGALEQIAKVDFFSNPMGVAKIVNAALQAPISPTEGGVKDAEIEKYKAALDLIAALHAKKEPHLGRPRWSGIEEGCFVCIAETAQNKYETTTAETFRAALNQLRSRPTGGTQ